MIASTTTEMPARVRGHLAELASLALPMIVSRAGLATMGMADAVMVSRFSAQQFAALSLANGTLGRIVDVFIAFILGGLILVPRAFGAGDLRGAFRVWQKTIWPALGLGLIACLVGLMGGRIFRLLGESDALASQAGAVSAILAVGYVGTLLAISAAVFLEGIKQPVVVAVSVVVANLLNIALNWVLVGGHQNVPAMGARGAAISTTVVTWVLVVVLVTFALRARNESVGDGERLQGQHQLGLSSAIVSGVMLTLTSSLLVFAGWMGALPLAALSVVWTLNGLPMLIALGVADATGIRVAAAEGKKRILASERPESVRQIVRFSLVSIAVCLVVFIGIWCVFQRNLAAVFTRENEMLGSLIVLIPLASCLMLLDGISFVVVSALRALKDIFWPTGIEIGTMIVLVPLAAWLAFHLSEGVRGLILAAIASAGLRVVLLIWRFMKVTA